MKIRKFTLMDRLVIVVGSCLLSSTIVFASDEFTVEWGQQFGSGYYDSGKGIAIDFNNNIFITGYLYTPGSYDGGFLQKYDNFGNLLWDQFVGPQESYYNFQILMQ